MIFTEKYGVGILIAFYRFSQYSHTVRVFVDLGERTYTSGYLLEHRHAAQGGWDTPGGHTPGSIIELQQHNTTQSNSVFFRSYGLLIKKHNYILKKKKRKGL